MPNTTNSRGSVWAMWDLQVQTILDDNYISLGSYSLNLKRNNAEKWTRFVKKVGGEENALLFDSKVYFNDVRIDKEERCLNYARNFLSFLEVFKPDLRCIVLTDHNYFDESLIDKFVKYSEHSHCKVLTGVEINCSGVHMLVVFNKIPYLKTNYSKGIQTFLTKIGVENQKTNDVLTVSPQSTLDVLNEVTKIGGLVIYPHCNSDNGLFKQHDKTNLVNTFNLQEINILQENKLSECDLLSEYINSNKKFNSNYCLTIGSDARSLRDVGSVDTEGNYLWIKSDPTFDGLMQIAYEPTDRVKIQKKSPYEDSKKIFFKNLSISGSNKFILPNFTLDLNRELISIIGGRGSGKSVLLDTVAFLNEVHLKSDSNDKKKVIEYYRTNEGHTDPVPSFNFSVKLVDKDNNETSFKKDLNNKIALGLPFLYIGQEQLSSLSTNDIELTKSICELLGIDNSKINISTIVSDARETLSSIDNLVSENLSLKKSYTEYDGTLDFEKWLFEKISKLDYQSKKLSSDETRKILTLINEITENATKLKELNIKVESVESELLNLRINDSLKELKLDIDKIYKDYKLYPLNVDLQLKLIKKLRTTIETDLTELRKKYLNQKELLIKMGIKEDVAGLLQSLESIQIQVSLLKKVQETYKHNNEKITDLIKYRNKFLIKVKNFLNESENEISQKFESFKTSKDDSSVEEKDLFEKIISGVEIIGDTIFKQNYFLDHLLASYIDKRKVSNKEQLKNLIAGSSESGQANEVTIESLFEWIKNKIDSLPEEYFISNGKRNIIEYLFTKWDEYLMVKAVIKLNSKPVEILSTGQRGTLLLKMFLATTGGGQILIVDQPEDNLDNDFIMNELVPLIRRIKKNRQVIMVTHNANLVVNGDSEQVVVADIENDTPYISGGLENPIINQRIKDILEGGEEAFKQRERKYNIS